MLASSDQWHLITAHSPLDVLTLPAHLGSFAAMRERAHEIPLGDVIVPIAHRDDLITLKRAAGRPRPRRHPPARNRSTKEADGRALARRWSGRRSQRVWSVRI
ncbi:hypothetical protein [Conexibacter sp. CPCC 206217]|uniref:hypothetical protein n=1 Tax=Conexibacter sp. CPCC 206217 TaxID=3064574 RepID=UPI00271D02EB|nr:hypothetical protein [Conexibacter sp. CPCC 206217]MDO8208902.1 hypothetical protein [Conexibacter sp. CPCC 206217]